jgi:hypothetical protein
VPADLKIQSIHGRQSACDAAEPEICRHELHYQPCRLHSDQRLDGRPLRIAACVRERSGGLHDGKPWLLEMFGEHPFDLLSATAVASLAFGLLAAYGWRARRASNPIFDLALFEIRTFRVSIMGGFITRLGVGGPPFLLPLLFQLGLGFSAWQSGLLMIPPALGAIGSKRITRGVEIYTRPRP